MKKLLPSINTNLGDSMRDGLFLAMRSAVFLAAATIAIALTALPVSAAETMTDRCSAEVAIVPYYNARPETPGTIILKRGADGRTDWTPPFTVDLSGSGRIRWWCHSTTGNIFDPGTYRIKELFLGTKCDLNADGVENCRFDAKFKLGSSAWEGWTPERSRCDNRSTKIRARLGPNRLLQIECLGH